MSNDPKKPADPPKSTPDENKDGDQISDGELSEQDLANVSGGSRVKIWNDTLRR